MPYSFFLGGNDLEMDAIRELLRTADGVEVHDDRLTWGAKASRYATRISHAIAHGRTPVLVELDLDIPLPHQIVTIVDHHGDRAGVTRETSLEQVFALLERPEAEWTRELALVAANDRGHIEQLVAAGATPDEVARLRRADRIAQGVSAVEESQAIDAIGHAQRLAPGLTLVRLPHSRTSPVTDMLHAALGGPGYDCLVIVSPDEVNVYADGKTIARLDATFQGGWKGGALPIRGFWGRTGPGADVVEFLRRLRAAA